MPPRPWSTVESDIALDFTPENVGAFFFKDKEIVEGLTTYSLQLMDFSENPKGDYVMLTFLSDGLALADGTYAVGNEMKDKTLFPGWYTFAGQMFHLVRRPRQHRLRRLPDRIRALQRRHRDGLDRGCR